MKFVSVTIQMKTIEQYFPVVLFVMLYKMVLTFESVDEILNCDHSNEGYRTVASCDAVYFSIVCKMKLGIIFVKILIDSLGGGTEG